MTDTITFNQTGGVSFNGREAVRVHSIIVTKGAIKMHKACGMIPTRGMTITKMLAAVSHFTGKTYKGKTKHDDAIRDLEAMLEATKDKVEIVQA